MGMSDDNEIQSRLTRMDDAFCARMRAAIAARLENAPIGVVTTLGTQSPKYVPAESSQRCGRLLVRRRPPALPRCPAADSRGSLHFQRKIRQRLPFEAGGRVFAFLEQHLWPPVTKLPQTTNIHENTLFFSTDV
jgi:hypothetical protein